MLSEARMREQTEWLHPCLSLPCMPLSGSGFLLFTPWVSGHDANRRCNIQELRVASMCEPGSSL